MMLLHWKGILAGEVTWTLSFDMPLKKNLMIHAHQRKYKKTFSSAAPNTHLLYDLI